MFSEASERSLERETGIEPATNSLEGCDSTTELLPPPLSTRFARNFGGQARSLPPHRFARNFAHLAVRLRRKPPRLLPARRFPASSLQLPAGLPAEAASEASAWRRLVAREGFEPSKPLGRQIYSLLRLTASLPRRSDCMDSFRRLAGESHPSLELAKGFEPPTG